ncbi:hypothetical protein QVD17_08664 [Tagetes erecta]|uniref:Uncharacterized protein n=1 Tax=Tagetes erecta TaxID=13708 RepID=A0AAD8L301_TARER|nr:hypothetical protein QVD17_08664 [Tagetes erecta]
MKVFLEDLVDEVPDNLLDDDEYFARHPEDEEEGENGDGDNDEDDDHDDSEDDGGNEGAESESNSEEAETVEIAEPMEVEMETVEIEEPAEVASGIEEVAVEVPKDIAVKYVRRKRSKSVNETVIVEPEDIDVLQIAQEAMAEAETMAQIVEEADAGVADPAFVDIPTTSPQIAENVEQAEGKRKIDAIPEIFGDEESSKRAKVDETVQIEPIQSVAEVEAEKTDEDVTKAEIAKTVQIEPIQSESAADTEVVKLTDSEKEVGSEETVQIEPIQSEAVDMPEIVSEVASQSEPVQTDDAPMIEALDDLDDIDFTESEDEVGPV